jgi:flagellar basal body-associated protein FliL
LGGLHVSPGTQFAINGNMPDAPASSASRNATNNSKAWMAVALALVLVGAGSFVWLRPQSSTSPAEGRGAESTLALETFVVNLNGSGQRAYLRIGITLGMARPFGGGNRPEGAPTALVRDTILSVLGAAQPEALLQAQGKRQLKGELLKALQERMPQMAIENVYFTEFLVQM